MSIIKKLNDKYLEINFVELIKYWIIKMENLNYTESADSQLPALNLLQKLGWKYIAPNETEKQRGGILSNVLLEGILEEKLKEFNNFEYKGGSYKFSEGNIHAAIHLDIDAAEVRRIVEVRRHVADLRAKLRDESLYASRASAARLWDAKDVVVELDRGALVAKPVTNIDGGLWIACAAATDLCRRNWCEGKYKD